MTTKIVMINLKPGMVWRRFPSKDWQTVKEVAYGRHEHGRIGVIVRSVGGGRDTSGAGTIVEIKEDN